METANQITDWFSLFVIVGALITSFVYRNGKDLLSIRIYIITSFYFQLDCQCF